MYTGRETRFDNPFGEHFFVVTINFRKMHKLGTLFLGKKDARHFLSAIHSICIYIPHTYTYDQFTAFFYEGRVYLSDTNYPIGQCCVDVMNMDEEVLDEIDRSVGAALEKNEQRRFLCTEENERCLGYYLHHAGVP